MPEVTLGWTWGQTQASRRTVGGMIARGRLIILIIIIIINKRISSTGKTKNKKFRATKLLPAGNGWRGSGWIEGPGYSARRGDRGSDATRMETAGGIAGWNRGIVEPWRRGVEESWSRGIVDAGEHWKVGGKTGEVTRRKQQN